jgi:hypothetical protein
MASAPKKTRLTREQLEQELIRTQKVEKQRTLARQLFPIVENLETIYDAQTAFQAAAGLIKYGVVKIETDLKVSDVKVDLSKDKPTPVSYAVKTMLELVANEPAMEMVELIEMMGSKLPGFLAQKHLKDPMSTISAKEYIAE